MSELLSELDSECLVLNLKTPVELTPSLPDYPVNLIDSTTLEIEISKHESINRLFQLLSELNIEVLSIRNKSNRLEQLFLHLVRQEPSAMSNKEPAAASNNERSTAFV